MKIRTRRDQKKVMDNIRKINKYSYLMKCKKEKIKAKKKYIGDFQMRSQRKGKLIF